MATVLSLYTAKVYNIYSSETVLVGAVSKDGIEGLLQRHEVIERVLRRSDRDPDLPSMKVWIHIEDLARKVVSPDGEFVEELEWVE